MSTNYNLFCPTGHVCNHVGCCINIVEYDLTLALLCKGIRMMCLNDDLINISEPTEKGCAFVFNNNPDLGRAISQYYNGDLQVNPFSYHKYDIELEKEIKKFLKSKSK